MNKTFLLIAISSGSVFAFQGGVQAQVGMHFINAPEMSFLQKEFDSTFVTQRNQAISAGSSAKFQSVPFQKTLLTFPIALQVYGQLNPYLRILAGSEWFHYQDNALILQDNQANQWNVGFKMWTAQSGVGLFIPKSLLSLDSTQNLRLELQRLWILHSRMDWSQGDTQHKAYALRSPWGAGWKLHLAYENQDWNSYQIGVKLGFSWLESSTHQDLAGFYPLSKPSGSLSWRNGGMDFSFSIGLGTQSPKKSTVESNTMDSTKLNPAKNHPADSAKLPKSNP